MREVFVLMQLKPHKVLLQLRYRTPKHLRQIVYPSEVPSGPRPSTFLFTRFRLHAISRSFADSLITSFTFKLIWMAIDRFPQINLQTRQGLNPTISRRSRGAMANSLFEKFDSGEIPANLLAEASKLFSSNYGVWGPNAASLGPFAKPGDQHPDPHNVFRIYDTDNKSKDAKSDSVRRSFGRNVCRVAPTAATLGLWWTRGW